jgi:FixJ family two-component response regulator
MDGEVELKQLKNQTRNSMVMISGHGDMETAINTMRLERLITYQNPI